MLNDKKNIHIVLLVILIQAVSFSKDLLPYWEAEVYCERYFDPKDLKVARELVAPKDGKYILFSDGAYTQERYKENYAKFCPEEYDLLVEFCKDFFRKSIHECMPHVFVQLSRSGNNRGFHPVEGVFIYNQGAPEELFLWHSYSCLDQDKRVDLSLLHQLTELKHLEIYGCSLKQWKGLVFSELKSLEYIGLPFDSDDDILDEIAFLERLTFINAAGTQITGRGFDSLSVLGSLNILDLRYTRLTEDAIASLKGIQSLKTLLLTGADVTDRHLEGIDALTGLQNLALSNTRITDAALEKIQALPNLRYLTLGGIPVSSRRLQALQQGHPELTISLDPVMTLGEYRERKLYRKAVVLGEVDAQISCFNIYCLAFRRHEFLKAKNLKDNYAVLPDYVLVPHDPIELLKWIYVLQDPRKTPEESERIKGLRWLAEAKETLEKDLFEHQKAESRRRADMILTLRQHYTISPSEEKTYDYLPVYQIKLTE